LSYEAWHGNVFDAILSDGVLQLIDISSESWAIALLPTLLEAGLLAATMPDASFGNSLRFGLRRLWLMNLRVSTGCCWHWPSAFDGCPSHFHRPRQH
jgi:hypothetical protein